MLQRPSRLMPCTIAGAYLEWPIPVPPVSLLAGKMWPQKVTIWTLPACGATRLSTLIRIAACGCLDDMIAPLLRDFRQTHGDLARLSAAGHVPKEVWLAQLHSEYGAPFEGEPEDHTEGLSTIGETSPTFCACCAVQHPSWGTPCVVPEALRC